jgi:hypothetical protein
MRYRNPYVKRFCKYLNISIRGKYEIIEAAQWFEILLSFALLNFIIMMQLKTLFNVTYIIGHYDFSLVPVEAGFNLMELLILLLSCCAFGHLFDGIIKCNNTEL